SQVALCMMLLMGAGLLVRSLAKLQGIDPGFERQNVVLLSVVPEMAGYKGPQVSHLESELLEKMRSLPGVQTASVSLFTPMGVCCIGSEAHIQGYTPRPGEDLTVNVNYLGPDHFRTLGTPVLLGREFNDGDTATSQKVAVINESMARRFFVDASPLGRTLSVDDETPLQIIGVVGDLKNRSLREKTMPSAYRPLLQSEAGGAVVFEIRTAAEPAGTISAMKRLVRSVDSRIPVGLGGTLAQQVSDSLAQERMVASLATVFGLLALLLANVGLYGLMAYAVTRRTGEIGIRMALGAGRGDVLWMVLRETLLLVTLGLAAGLPLALAATRLIKSQLFGLTVTDPTTILVTIMAMLAVAVLASYLPARKATRVNPITALRYE
ncbi:MAG TPA: FtsX-like permease family protein, partial [Alphaproteobacteria bacterium]|nr:FtsX-like permease family protein [Alphaproteobacteria bacterium]